MFSLKKSNNSDLHTSTISAPGSQGDLYDVIFPLLRASLWGEDKFPFTAPPNTDWDAVYEELCHQTVQHLPVDILCREDPKNRQKYILNATRAVRNWHKIMQAQQDLYELFQKEEIPFVILKGAAADCYYPKPEYRCMGDIDLIVKPEDFERAEKVMVDAHYSVIEKDTSRHVEYKKDNVIFELHHYFAVLNEEGQASFFDAHIFNALNYSTEALLGIFSFPMLPIYDNGLILLQHIRQHLESGLGLRQIIDWMLYVNKALSDDAWNNYFEIIADQAGLKHLAIATTRMSQIYLGLNENIAWCKNCDIRLYKTLAYYIMNQGNFGRKQTRDSKSAVNSLNASKNIKTLFTRLQYRGALNWTLLKKCPWLEPLAWAYQVWRYIHLGFKREHPIKQLYLDLKRSHVQNSLFDDLDVIQQKNGIITPSGKKF